jgi:hypothetical protein
MISLISEPERIKEGETLKVKLNIQGQSNLKMYKGAYFNLMLKKNGGTSGLGQTTLYPLKFNGFPLEWEVNPNSYESDGTFNVGCVEQSGSKNQIASTTFIREPDCVVKKVNTCNNITSIEQTKRFKESQIKKQEIPIDYMVGCQIQKPGVIVKEEIVLEEPSIVEFKTILVSSAKVQRAGKNVNPI